MGEIQLKFNITDDPYELTKNIDLTKIDIEGLDTDSDKKLSIYWGDGDEEAYNLNSLSTNYTSHTFQENIGEVITTITSYDGTEETRDATIKLSSNFWQNISISSIKVENVTLYSNAFSSVSYLTEIIIGSNVELRTKSFAYCDYIENIIIESEYPEENVGEVDAPFYDIEPLNYDLYWTTPSVYSEQIRYEETGFFSVNEATTFTIPPGTTEAYIEAGYPSARLIERRLPFNKLYIKKNGESITLLDEQDIQSRINNVEVPTKTSDLTNDSGFLTQHQDISGKANVADLATVATSGSYNDLTDKPTIPTVDVIKIVSDKGTASASTMDKLFIEVGANKRDVYYTEEDNGSYLWHKLDVDILDDLSLDWDSIANKPSVEVTTNKTLIVSSSSTDTQYPSAKAVFDAIDDIITIISDETEATSDGIYLINDE